MEASKTPKVSILVPCCNVEKYVTQCLDSLVSQTLKEIEIICINDGSSDSTIDILKAFAKRDSRVSIIDKANSGYGDSMNQGLDLAKGEYVGIVESDDFVELDMFETLYHCAKEHSLDICRAGYFIYKHGKDESVVMNEFVPKNRVVKPLDSSEPFYQAPAIWSAIYKRDFLNSCKIRFLPTPGASYQDTSFAFKCYLMAERFLMLDKAFLHYRQDNPNSSVKSSGKIFCVKDEWCEAVMFSEENNRFDQIKRHLLPLQYGTYRWNYQRLSSKAAWQFLSVWSKEWKILKSKGCGFDLLTSKQRWNALMIIHAPWLYHLIKQWKQI